MQNDETKRLPPITSHLLALAVCGLAVAICLPLRDVLDLTNIAMLLLLTVVFIAARLGRSQAVLASFVSVALFDFFFVPPHLSFLVSDVPYVVTFAVMLAVSLVISHLTTSLQASAREARDRERQSQALYALARALAGAISAEQVAQRAATFVRDQADGEPCFFLPDAEDKLHAFPPANVTLGLDESLVLDAVYHSHAGEPSCSSSGPNGLSLLFPLAGATRRHGVLLVRARGGDRLEGLRPMFEAVASLTVIALERLRLVELAQTSQMETEAERLRSSILSSISHDIRTPLTVLFGQADSLALAEGHLSGEEREAAQAIRDQAGRLNQMVEKLLDMARLQTGQVRLHKEWQAVDEVIGASIQLLGDALNEHPVKVSLAPDLSLVAMDAVLMERVFCNLIDTASSKPDLVILDLGLPDGEGADFVSAVRDWSRMPVLILSARSDETDKITALDAGADDYLTKPFSVGELLARVRALLRRADAAGDPRAALVRFGDVEVDLARRTVLRAGESVHLTAREYRLLVVLLANAGKVMTHRQLLREVWGPGYVDSTHYLRIYVGHLRQKLEADPTQPAYLRTEIGVGYRFQA